VTITPSNKALAVANKAPVSSIGTARRAASMPAMLLGVAALAPLIPRIAHASRKLAVAHPAVMLAQDDDDSGDVTADKGASPDQIERYVAVYRAMQRNHSMTVDQAAASQGLSVGAFRDLERRIESDDLARDDARRALAAPAGSATPTSTPKAQR